MSEFGIDTLDSPKINMQKVVNVITQRSNKNDEREEKLHEILVNLGIFWDQETKEDAKIPIQFEPDQKEEFKKLVLPISTAMWAVDKVVMHMRTELYKFERGMTPDIPITPIAIPAPEAQTKVEVNTAKPEKESRLDKINIFKKPQRDSFSPYALALEGINYSQKIKPK